MDYSTVIVIVAQNIGVPVYSKVMNQVMLNVYWAVKVFGKMLSLTLLVIYELKCKNHVDLNKFLMRKIDMRLY